MNDEKNIEIVLRVRGSFILALIAASWFGFGVFLGIWLGSGERDVDNLLTRQERVLELAIEQAERRDERIKRIDAWVDEAMTGK
jgi:hypothetical protein